MHFFFLEKYILFISFHSQLHRSARERRLSKCIVNLTIEWDKVQNEQKSRVFKFHLSLTDDLDQVHMAAETLDPFRATIYLTLRMRNKFNIISRLRLEVECSTKPSYPISIQLKRDTLHALCHSRLHQRHVSCARMRRFLSLAKVLSESLGIRWRLLEARHSSIGEVKR